MTACLGFVTSMKFRSVYLVTLKTLQTKGSYNLCGAVGDGLATQEFAVSIPASRASNLSEFWVIWVFSMNNKKYLLIPVIV